MSTEYSPVVKIVFSVISTVPFLDLIPVVSVPIESQMAVSPVLDASEVIVLLLTNKLFTFTPIAIV